MRHPVRSAATCVKVRPRGFTLIELAVVVAIIAVLSVLAYGISRSAVHNANLGSATYDLAIRLQGLRTTAMSNGQDYLAVVVDAPGDASGCGAFASSQCGQLFVLKNPAPAWVLDAFDPASPATNAEFVTSETFARTVHFATAAPASVAPPFSTLTTADPDLTATCAGRTCFAVRFGSDGTVQPQFKQAITPTVKAGYVFGLESSAAVQNGAADRRAILVAFPAGLVKTFSF